MKEPLVTVFMPVYNSEQYIKEAVESILNQTYKNLEIILVDDGSTDRSIEIIKSYKDDRIRLIQNEKNMGIPYTRNVGLKEAKGKYIAIMDSDDIATPKRIERQVDYLEKNPDIDAVGSYYIQFGEKAEKKVTPKYTKPEELKIMLMFYNPIANPSATVRKETLDKHNIKYNLDFFVAQDYQLWVQLAKVGKIEIIPEFLLKYRFGHENISKKSNREKREKRKQLISRIHEDMLAFLGVDFTEEELNVFNEFFIESYGSAVSNISTVPKVIEKLKQWNYETQTFDQDLFLSILDDCILLAIFHQSLSAKEKVTLYKQLTSNRQVKDYLIILLKHYYHRIKKVN